MDDEKEVIGAEEEVELPADDAEDDLDTDDTSEDEGEETEESEDDEEDKGEQEKAPVGRANSRIRTLDSERKAEREKREKAEAETERLRKQLDEVRANQHRARSAEDEQKEAERLANMEPHERVAYIADKKIDALTREMRNAQLQNIDINDRNQYLQKASSNPLYAKHAPAVEAALSGMREKGMNTTREEILAYLVGKAALSGGPNPLKDKAKKAASERVAAVKGKTVNGRSDTSSTRKGKSIEDRLANVQL